MFDMKVLPSRVGCALAILFLVTLSGAIIGGVILSPPRHPRRKMAFADRTRISIALDTYHLRFRAYPPDTGYGLDMEKSPGTYDPGSLWRYLVKPVRDPETGEKVGPFIAEWNPKQLKPYNDARAGPSCYLADPWGSPYGFVGERKRVIHNKDSFDLFSPGRDRVTASDRHGTKPNLAYDGLDNDGNGIVDDSAELGPDASRNGEVGDDINNWSVR